MRPYKVIGMEASRNLAEWPAGIYQCPHGHRNATFEGERWNSDVPSNFDVHRP